MESFLGLLPDPLNTLLKPTLQNLTSTPLSSLRSTYIDPYITDTPLSTLLATYFSSSSMPDLLSLILLAAILFISLQILNYIRRVVVFWVSLVLRLTFYAVFLGAVLYVYRVGWGKAVEDFGWAWGVAEGFVGDYQARKNNLGSQNGRGYGDTTAYRGGYV